MGAFHNASVEATFEGMDAETKASLAEAGQTIAAALDTTPKQVADWLVEAQGGGTLTPVFEAVVRALQTETTASQ